LSATATGFAAQVPIDFNTIFANTSLYATTGSTNTPANGHVSSYGVNNLYSYQTWKNATINDDYRFRTNIGGVWQPWLQIASRNWVAAQGYTTNSGTVTSVGLTVPTGLTITSGSPVTSAGTIAVGLQSGYSIPTTADQANWNGSFYYRGSLANGNDLNTFTTEGNYNISSTVAGSLINSPYTGSQAASLEVIVSGSYVTQRYVISDGGNLNKVYLRTKNASGWNSWVQQWTGADFTATNITNWNTAYTNRISSLTTTGSSGAATLSSNVLNIPQYTLAGLGGISLTSLSASAPLNYNSGTGAFSIAQADATHNGYLSLTDWNTFNGKQNAITNGTGFLKNNGSGTWSYDNNTYLTTSSASSTYIPLAGSSAITGSLIPSVTSTIDLGSSTKKWNTVYTTDIQSGGGTFAGTLNTSNLVASNQITGDVVVGISGLSLGNATSNNQVAFKNTLLTANHNYELPNADGTLALTTNIPAQFNPSAGTGISLSGTYPNVTITALNSNPLWNANMLQGVGIDATVPTNGQVLQVIAGQWTPINAPWLTSYIETDPIANAKTVTLTAGTGISITGAAQTVGSNPSFTVAAQNTSALWNASQFQGFNVQSGSPSTNDIWQFQSGQWRHTQPTWISSANLSLGTATSTTIPLNIDAGTGVTLPAVTTSTAGLMTASDKVKLNGIATGAEVNVQADYNQTNTSADDYVKNKPISYDGNNYLQPTSAKGVNTKGALGTAINPNVTASTYTILDSDHSLIFATSTTIAMPDPTQFPNRMIWLRIREGVLTLDGYEVYDDPDQLTSLTAEACNGDNLCSNGVTYVIQSDGVHWYLMMRS
jgi:hypothetical protein